MANLVFDINSLFAEELQKRKQIAFINHHIPVNIRPAGANSVNEAVFAGIFKVVGDRTLGARNRTSLLGRNVRYINAAAFAVCRYQSNKPHRAVTVVHNGEQEAALHALGCTAVHRSNGFAVCHRQRFGVVSAKFRDESRNRNERNQNNDPNKNGNQLFAV